MEYDLSKRSLNGFAIFVILKQQRHNSSTLFKQGKIRRGKFRNRSQNKKFQS